MAKWAAQVVAAAIRHAFTQPDQKAPKRSRATWPTSLRPRLPKLAVRMDESRRARLHGLSAQHRIGLHSTNPLERLNKEVTRRANIAGIFPSKKSIIRPIGAVLFEQTDGRQSQPRPAQVYAFALINAAQVDQFLGVSRGAASTMNRRAIPKAPPY